MNLIIRADASPAIGIGHLMRCVALAQHWDGPVHFVSHCESITLSHYIQSQGFQWHSLSNPAAGWEQLTNLRTKTKPQAVVFDGYAFTPQDLRRARSLGFTTALIDDNATLPEYPVDVLINQNLCASSLQYRSADEALRLLGCNYALVRKEFLSTSLSTAAAKRSVPCVLITIGGSDTVNMTPLIVDALCRVGGLDLVVVGGVANPRLAQLRQVFANDPAVRFEASTFDMPRLMREADIVVTAAGSTCWECCYLGLPMLTVVVAENQRRNAEALAAAGAAINLGWHEQLTIDSVQQQIGDLLRDEQRLQRVRSNAKNLVDGEGASRVVRTIENCIQNRKSVRV
jgi:UDP-2,4-diacetamido-2,4,6-trideoxy-beta-L-altropyranose hydrolase